MVLPSSVNLFRLPSFQTCNLLSRQVMWSFVFDLRCGFWRSRIGMMTVALRAMDSIEEAEAKAENKLESSRTNSLPLLPVGTLKLFRLQWTTSAYVPSSA